MYKIAILQSFSTDYVSLLKTLIKIHFDNSIENQGHRKSCKICFILSGTV